MGGRYLCTSKGVDILEDITPAIMGDVYLEYLGEEIPEGPWVGDVVTPTNDRPGLGFTDVTLDYTI